MPAIRTRFLSRRKSFSPRAVNWAWENASPYLAESINLWAVRRPLPSGQPVVHAHLVLDVDPARNGCQPCAHPVDQTPLRSEWQIRRPGRPYSSLCSCDCKIHHQSLGLVACTRDDGSPASGASIQCSTRPTPRYCLGSARVVIADSQMKNAVTLGNDLSNDVAENCVPGYAIW